MTKHKDDDVRNLVLRELNRVTVEEMDLLKKIRYIKSIVTLVTTSVRR
jgi:hypothetical protein